MELHLRFYVNRAESPNNEISKNPYVAKGSRPQKSPTVQESLLNLCVSTRRLTTRPDASYAFAFSILECIIQISDGRKRPKPPHLWRMGACSAGYPHSRRLLPLRNVGFRGSGQAPRPTGPFGFNIERPVNPRQTPVCRMLPIITTLGVRARSRRSGPFGISVYVGGEGGIYCRMAPLGFPPMFRRPLPNLGSSRPAHRTA